MLIYIHRYGSFKIVLTKEMIYYIDLKFNQYILGILSNDQRVTVDRFFSVFFFRFYVFNTLKSEP